MSLARKLNRQQTLGFLVVSLTLLCCPIVHGDEARLEIPKTSLLASELAVVINEDDPLSEQTARYYQEKRGIPAENFLRVRFPWRDSNLPRREFARLKAKLDEITPANIQGYALAWTKPYQVDCMSITSAIAFGFDEAYCSATRCATTKASPYFNSDSGAPYSDYKIRPAMLLAGKTLEDVKRLIDRGVKSDFTYPTGSAYLLDTKDKARSVRSVLFDSSRAAVSEAFRVEQLKADYIRDKTDVMFYFTGAVEVSFLKTLRFVPGAVGDHLTSVGGDLMGSKQMSSLRWLEAGATASFGAVVEPCNHLQKFPFPGVVMQRYLTGNSILEAYWKSVAWPGEGLFIGEPLAKPFAPRIVERKPGAATLEIFTDQLKNLRLEKAESAIGPYIRAEVYPLKPGHNRLEIKLPESSYHYRMVF